MIKMLLSVLLVSYFTQPTFAQKKYDNVEAVSIPEYNCSSVENLSSYLKQNYDTDSSRIRAIYVWIANYISYDVVRLQDLKRNKQSQPQTVADVLRLRSAVCQGYSELFVSLCKNVGIDAFVVPGYVKLDRKILPMAHAWVAAELNEEWFLFDPTWGAGYIANDQFVKRFSNTFYKQCPKDFISDHMPFDPLYQFLLYPKSNSEFIDGTTTGNKQLFNYKDSLLQYNKLSSSQQIAAASRRMEGAGIGNELLQEQRRYWKQALQSYASNNASEQANKSFSKAISLINEYFGQKNKQFISVSDNDLLGRIDSMKHYIKIARSFLSEEIVQNEAHQRIKTNNLASMDQFWKQLHQEEQFVKKYIDTDKASRKQLFIKM